MSEKKKSNQTLKDLYESLIESDLIQLNSQLPLEKILPQPIVSSALTPTEQKIYLQQAIEFQIILSKVFSYQEGLYRWSLLLDDRLQYYGLTRDAWGDIVARGNQDRQLKTQLQTLSQKITIILEKYEEKPIQMETLKRDSSLRSFQLSDSTNALIVSS